MSQINREDIIAEIRRRQAAVAAPEPEAPAFDREAIIAEIQRRQHAAGGSVKAPGLDPINQQVAEAKLRMGRSPDQPMDGLDGSLPPAMQTMVEPEPPPAGFGNNFLLARETALGRESMRIQSEGGVGSFLGTMAGGLVGSVDPRSQEFGPAVGSFLTPVAKTAGLGAKAVQFGIPTIGLPAGQQAAREDWSEDPIGATKRTLGAGAVGAGLLGAGLGVGKGFSKIRNTSASKKAAAAADEASRAGESFRQTLGDVSAQVGESRPIIQEAPDTLRRQAFDTARQRLESVPPDKKLSRAEVDAILDGTGYRSERQGWPKPDEMRRYLDDLEKFGDNADSFPLPNKALDTPEVPRVQEAAPQAKAPPQAVPAPESAAVPAAVQRARSADPAPAAGVADGPPARDPSLTSSRKEWMAEDRKALGLDDLPEPQRRAWDTDLDSARAKGPDYGRRVVDDILANPRAMDPTENAGAVMEAARLKGQHRELSERLNKATDPADQAFAAAELRRVQDEFDRTSQALRSSGTAAGRDLAARKLTIDQDMDLISVKSRARAAKGEPLTELESGRLAKLVTQLEEVTKQVDELTAKIDAAKVPVEAPTPKATTPKADPASKLRSQIDDLQQKVDDPNFKPPAKPKKQPPETKELERLEYERDRLRRQLNQQIDDMKPKGPWDNQTLGAVAEVGHTSRNIVASADFSAVLRQGGFVAAGHPVMATKAMKPMFEAFGTSGIKGKMAERRIMQEIQSRPNAPLYARSKLGITEIGGKLSGQEERFMSHIADKIPLVAGSQRAYTTYLNRLRADYFDYLVDTLGHKGAVTEAEAKVLANYVNIATGRGNLGKFEDAGVLLNAMFFAPKLVASRFQLLGAGIRAPLDAATGFRLRPANERAARKLIAKEYARSLSGIGAFYGMVGAGISAGVLPGVSLTFDPRSSDFGKIVIGNTRIDPLMGLAQVTRLISTLAAGERVNQRGQVVPIRGDNVPFGQPDGGDVIERFVRTKFNPLTGAAWDRIAGKDVVGEKVTLKSTVAGLAIPLTFRGIYENMQEHGVVKGQALSMLEIFGMGVQVQDQK
jgi:hypothetical protein